MTASVTSRKIMLCTVRCGKTSITYRLERKAVKNINLRINANEEIWVSANTSVSQGRINAFVLEQKSFIERALAKIRRRNSSRPARQTYETGSTVYVWGSAWPLTITEKSPLAVTLKDRIVYMDLGPSIANADRENLFHQFLKYSLQEHLQELFTPIYNAVSAKYPIPLPQIRIRWMKTRWGSCTPLRRAITLNAALAAVSPECAAYVILHELCHFIQPNHSKAFYALVGQFMPNWQELRQQLNQYPL